MKITSIETPEGNDIWHGFADCDGRCFQWFIELDGSWFKVREEEVRCRHIDKNGNEQRCFMNLDEPPDGAKEAVLKAIRASLS